MLHKNKAILLALACSLSVVLSGCGIVGLFDTRPLLDQEVDPSGKTLISDTPRNFKFWKASIDRDIEREATGIAASRAAGGTWKGHWKGNIQGIRKNSTNPDRYIDYIISARRARGLPEL